MQLLDFCILQFIFLHLGYSRLAFHSYICINPLDCGRYSFLSIFQGLLQLLSCHTLRRHILSILCGHIVYCCLLFSRNCRRCWNAVLSIFQSLLQLLSCHTLRRHILIILCGYTVYCCLLFSSNSGRCWNARNLGIFCIFNRCIVSCFLNLLLIHTRRNRSFRLSNLKLRLCHVCWCCLNSWLFRLR